MSALQRRPFLWGSIATLLGIADTTLFVLRLLYGHESGRRSGAMGVILLAMAAIWFMLGYAVVSSGRKPQSPVAAQALGIGAGSSGTQEGRAPDEKTKREDRVTLIAVVLFVLAVHIWVIVDIL